MGNVPIANIQAVVAAAVTAKSYQNRAIFTFVPSTSTFLNAYKAQAASDDVFTDPNTGEALVMRLTFGNWMAKLKALGATSAEPVWHAVNGHFHPTGEPDSNGISDVITLPDFVYIGRRTSATPTIKTLTFTTNTEGTVVFDCFPAKYIFANNVPKGELARITVAADGVLTVTQLATVFRTAFNLAIPSTIALAAAGGPGANTVTSAADGYPIVILVRSSDPGPTVTQTDDTSVIAAAYSDDMAEMRAAAEQSADPLVDAERRWYWWTDLQGNDAVNAQGFAYVDAQGLLFPVVDYQFKGWSTDPANYDPLASNSPAQNAQAANGGEGWHRSVVVMHPRWEFIVPVWLGRCIGYQPGEVNFADRSLYGSVPDAKLQKIDYLDNESTLKERFCDYYASDGPHGCSKWGALADGSYTDRKWLEDWVRRVGQDALRAYLQVKNIVQYTDADIEGGAGVLQNTLRLIPAIDPAAITVTFKTRREVDANNIANRIYIDYFVVCGGRGVINQIGTPENPIQITVIENLQG